MELVQEYAADLGIHHGLSPIPAVGLTGTAQREELALPTTPWTWALEKTELDCSGLPCGMCFFSLSMLPVVSPCPPSAGDGSGPLISHQHSGPPQHFPKMCPAGAQARWHRSVLACELPSSAWMEWNKGRMSPTSPMPVRLVRMV